MRPGSRGRTGRPSRSTGHSGCPRTCPPATAAANRARARRAAAPSPRTKPRCRARRAPARPRRSDRRAPARLRQPDLGPGVRVRLAHDQVAAERVPVAALVAGDDARRDPGRAHQGRECRGEVPAEALARVEEEIVDRIAREARAASACSRTPARGTGRARPARTRRRCRRARAVCRASSAVRGLRPRGSCRLAVPERRRELVARAIARVRARVVTQHCVDGRRVRSPKSQDWLARPGVQLSTMSSANSIVLPGRLERHRVVDRCARVATAGRRKDCSVAARPGIAVELRAIRGRASSAAAAAADCPRSARGTRRRRSGVRSEMSPGDISSVSPVSARSDDGAPQKLPATRGKKKNRTSATGAAFRSIAPVVRNGRRCEAVACRGARREAAPRRAARRSAAPRPRSRRPARRERPRGTGTSR